MPWTYTEARLELVRELTRSAEAHEAHRLGRVAERLDVVDAHLPRDAGEEFDPLLMALAFLEGWLDARDHDWLHYAYIGRDDWPRLARTVVADLLAHRAIRDPAVLHHFAPRVGR